MHFDALVKSIKGRFPQAVDQVRLSHQDKQRRRKRVIIEVGEQLSPLKLVLANPSIRKIFHAADYDLRSLKRDFDLEINGPIKDPRGNHRAGAEGELVIDRQDYGVKFSKVMDNGGLIVANDVKIAFSLEAYRKLGE